MNASTYRDLIRLTVMAWALAGLGACGGIDQMESSYQGRHQELIGLVGRVDPTKRGEIEATRARFATEYAALPADPAAREPGLGSINQRMRQYIEQTEAYANQQASQAAAQQQAAAASQAATLRQQLVGVWQSPIMSLTVAPTGMVEYRRSNGATNTSVNAPITDVGPGYFKVGVLGIDTTFRIDVPPHQDGAVWKMTVDGVELTRAQ